jgi:iron-sulfur cluster assembly protein
VITITEAAAARLNEIVASIAHEKQTSPETFYLRVRIKGGGCSGFTYELSLEQEEMQKNDKSFTSRGIRIVVDSKSYLYLVGSEIDYESQGLNSGFVIKNPNVKSTCGCGKSHAF